MAAKKPRAGNLHRGVRGGKWSQGLTTSRGTIIDIIDFMRTLDKNKTLFGTFIELPTPASIEIAAHAGWDFVVIDCEHAPISTNMLPEYIRAAEAAGVAAIVRVAMNNAEWLQAALDSGAAGVQIPQIASVEQARAAVEMARFHPIGKRGFNGFVRAARYSAEPLAEYVARSNKDTALILQLESADAVTNADLIAAIPGVDAIFVGPYDLSQSMGIPGDVTNPAVLAAGQRVMATAAANGLAGAVFVNTVQAARIWATNGARWISFSTDTYLLSEAQRNARAAVAS